ncbi:MAG: hypothetical protein WEE89_04215 [Gemmatimonadota bacterium]
MMKSNRRAIGWLALGLAATLGACDSVDQVNDVNNVEARPAFSKGGQKMQQLVKLHTPAVGETGSITVGPKGGSLTVGGHMLHIPDKAVNKQTLFIMTVMPGDYIHVDLQAFNRDGTPITTFKNPVWLGLSYAGITGSADKKLTVTYLVDGTVEGATESVTSFMYEAYQMVFGQLHHFSSYSAAID